MISGGTCAFGFSTEADCVFPALGSSSAQDRLQRHHNPAAASRATTAATSSTLQRLFRFATRGPPPPPAWRKYWLRASLAGFALPFTTPAPLPRSTVGLLPLAQSRMVFRCSFEIAVNSRPYCNLS